MSAKQKCPHCPGRFHPDRYAAHIFECKASKPFPCEICPRRFTTHNGAKQHEAKDHTAQERRTRFQCRYCEQGSNDHSAMVRHENTHEEAGGPGFRHRSRSRSRLNVSSSEVYSGSTPRNRSRSHATMANEAPRSRGRSHTTMVNEAHKTPLKDHRSRASTNSFNWASNKPTSELIQQEEMRQRSTSTNYSFSRARSIQNEAPTHSAASTIGSRNAASNPRQFISGDANDHHHRDGANNVSRFVFPGFAPTHPGSSAQTAEAIQGALIKIALIDPEYALRVMESQEKRLDDAMRQIRVDNKAAREYCRRKHYGILREQDDPIERMVKEYEAEYNVSL